MAKVKFSYILKISLLGIIMCSVTAAIVMKVIFSLSTITMPDFKGISIENTKKVAEKLRLELKIEDQVYNNMYEAGAVVSQSIKPKAKIKKGRVIYVTVSKGSKMVVVPDITGLAKSKGFLNLKNADLSEGFEAEITSPIYKENSIICQSPPAGETVPYDHKVNILKSKGPRKENFMMPDFKGTDVFEVYKILKQRELFVEQLSIETDNEMESGTIIEQSPSPGYIVNEDIPITIIASKKDGDVKLKKRFIKINFKLEGYKVSKFVKIKVLSLNGSESVYKKITEPEEIIRTSAAVRGDALVQFFIGNDLVTEKEFPAPGGKL